MKTKTFLLKDIVEIDYGNKFDLQKMTFENPIVNFISRTALNNGVAAKVDRLPNKLPYKAGNLTIALGGSIGATFYQNKPFYTGQNIAVIKFKNNISKYAKLYLCQIIKFEVKKRFRAFGRELNKHIKTDFTVDLPIDSLGNPNWLYMETYIKNLHSRCLTTNNQCSLNPLEFDSWKEFKIDDLFDVCGTKTTKIEELETYGGGEYPYVTTQAVNNGVANKYNYFTENGGVLTVDSAVLGFSTFQEKQFSASDHVEKLIPRFKMNKYIALFFVTLLNKECYKYSYGRKANQNQIRNTKLRLPSKNGQPDWQFMEDYIKSLPYADKI